ncbi:MAG: polysaccharide deacetylase family protein [Oscillospiraceae bacterium]|nr:polysaccharide deacetylase family protein [Oscillospiraceae bacterium]
MRKMTKIIISAALATALSFSLIFSPAAVASSANDPVAEFVTRLYQTALSRQPDPAGLEYWVNRLKSGQISGAGAAYGFIFSEEMKNKNLTNDRYVEILYNTLLGRRSEPGGKIYWLNNLRSGMSKFNVFLGFAFSAEFSSLCAAYGIKRGDVDHLPSSAPANWPESTDRLIDPSKPMIALTFDDGPTNFTPQILDVLAAHDILATFFLQGNRIEKNKSTILRAFLEGHEIANHSWSHNDLTAMTASRASAEVKDTCDAITSITGVPPTSFRPPYGYTDSSVNRIAAELGLDVVMWTVNSQDYSIKDAAEIYDRTVARVSNGGIILMHDIQSVTVEAIKLLIPKLLEEGYQFVTVSELLLYR